MKRAINGKFYDTEKAQKIGEYTFDEGPQAIANSSMNWWTAALYRKPQSGHYFLAGRGGELTAFAKGRVPGERIIPLSYEQARRWAETYLDPVIAHHWFGDYEEA